MNKWNKLPEVVDTPYPYVAIRDLREIGTRFSPLFDSDIAAEHEEQLSLIQQEYAPRGSTLYSIDSDDVTHYLNALSVHEVSRADKSVGVIHLDKYIGLEDTHENYFRLDISRNSEDTLVSRNGSKFTIDEQLLNLRTWLSEKNYEQVVLVDDVLAFGSTLPPLVREVRQSAPDTEVRIAVALAASGGIWQGVENVVAATSIVPEYLCNIQASPPIDNGTLGMALPPSADLTIFGGKVSSSAETHATSVPYVLPFSVFKSIFETSRIIEASIDVLEFNHSLLTSIEKCVKKKLYVKDALVAGYGIPVTNLAILQDKSPQPHSDDALHDVVNAYRDLLVDNDGLIRDNLARNAP